MIGFGGDARRAERAYSPLFPANPALLQGKTVLKREICTRHGYGRNCTMIVTDRRLIFKTLYNEDWFPLSHIKSVLKTGIFLRVEFDNGRTETIFTFTADAWGAEIERARVNAPGMDYAPGNEKAPQGYSRFIVVLLAAAVIGFRLLHSDGNRAVYLFLDQHWFVETLPASSILHNGLLKVT